MRFPFGSVRYTEYPGPSPCVFVGFDAFGCELFDQLLGILRSFDIERVVRHTGKLFFRRIQRAESSFAGAQAIDFNAGEVLLRATPRRGELIEIRHGIQLRCLKIL